MFHVSQRLFLRGLLIALGLWTGAMRLVAQGGPPFITDDPGTPADRHWEIDVAWTHERRAGETANELPLVDVNYGCGDALELNFEIPFIHHDAADGVHERAVGDSLFGVKWRFLDQKTGGPDPREVAPVSMSVYPQFGFRTPGSSAYRRGLVDGGTTIILPVEVTRELGGGWGIDADFGHELHSRSGNTWFGGAVLGRDFTEKISVGAELHVETDDRFGREVVTANIGGHWEIAPKHALLISVGREIRNRQDAKASFVSYVGWQLTF